MAERSFDVDEESMRNRPSPSDDRGSTKRVESKDYDELISELIQVKAHSRLMKRHITRTFELMDDRSSIGRSLWCHLPKTLQSDPEIALIAWTRKFTDGYRPPCLDTEYLHAALQSQDVNYHCLPATLRQDANFFLEISSFPYHEMVLDMFDQFPSLATNRLIWEKIIDSNVDFGTLELILDRCPFLRDRDMMLKICQKRQYSRVLRQFTSTGLIQTRDFVEEVLKANPLAMVFLPRQGQSLFPDLIINYIGDFGKDSGCTLEHAGNLACNLTPELWNDRTMVLSWCRAGLPFPESSWYYYADNGVVVPRPWEQWRNDEEVFLLLTKNCRFRDHESLPSFREASRALVANKTFMLQAVEIDSRTFRYVSPELQDDFDLALLAFSNSQCSWGQKHAPLSFLKHIQEQLDAHARFISGFLVAISFATKPCTLSLLDQQVLKMRIAEFAGIPTGKRLRLLRRARRNAILSV